MAATLTLLLTIAALGGAVLAADTISDSDTLPTDLCYCLQPLVSNLRGPVATVFFNDQNALEERVIVVEQVGLAKVYSKAGEFKYVFMDIQDRVMVTEEVGESRGLLSLVLDPMYNTNKKVYVYYIRNVDGNDYAYVSSFKAPGNVVDKTSEMTLFRVYQPYANGNGGPMLFGDDGYLYVATGDGGGDDDVNGNAQNKNTFHGKVLRLDVDGAQSFSPGESSFGKLYGVPSSNPFVNTSGAMEEIYALGIRNMWGCSQDVASLGGTGRIFCAETGTNKSDEINVIEKGMNYGWNLKEGSHCMDGANCSNIENEGVPIYEFVHTASHSLVGGHVYRGHAFPSFNTSSLYTYGDVVTGKVYVLEEPGSGPWTSLEWPYCGQSSCPTGAKAAPLPHVFAFGRDLSGELYLMMTSDFVVKNPGGAMFKVVPAKGSGEKLVPTLSLVLAVLVALLWNVRGHF